MLSGKQKSFLRAKAHHLKPIFQVGRGCVQKNMVAQLMDVLEKRELNNIHILQNCLEDKHEVADKISKETGAELVQIIGNHIILYKESQENKTIHLPD